MSWKSPPAATSLPSRPGGQSIPGRLKLENAYVHSPDKRLGSVSVPPGPVSLTPRAATPMMSVVERQESSPATWDGRGRVISSPQIPVTTSRMISSPQFPGMPDQVIWDGQSKMMSPRAGLPGRMLGKSAEVPTAGVLWERHNLTSSGIMRESSPLLRSGLGSPIPSGMGHMSQAPPLNEILSLISSRLSEHETRIVSHLLHQGQALQQIQRQLDQQQQHIVAAAEVGFQKQALQNAPGQGLQRKNTKKQTEQGASTLLTAETAGTADCKSAEGGNIMINSLDAPLLSNGQAALYDRQVSPASYASEGSSKDDGGIMASSVMPKQLRCLGKSTSNTRISALFPSVDEIRDKISESLRSHAKETEDYYFTTGIVQAVARHAYFRNSMLCAVVANVVWIGIETDYNKAGVLCNADLVFQVSDNLFCCIFVFELIVRFMAFAQKISALRDPWFVFDALLVCLMVWESWLTVALYWWRTNFGSTSIEDEKIAQHSQLLRMVRLVRLAKIARTGELVYSIPELYVLGQGVLRGIRSVLVVFSMMLLIIYAYGVLFTMLLSGTDVGGGVFDSVLVSMNTLLLHVLCGPDSDFMRSLLTAHWPSYVCFLTFILIAVVVLMNMVTAMLCDVVSLASNSSKEEALVKLMEKQLSRLEVALDADGDGTISRKEFEIMIQDPLLIQSFIELNVDIASVAHFAKFLYDQCESISYADFGVLVSRFRADKGATGKDMMELRHYLTMEILELGSQLGAEGEEPLAF